MDSEPPPSLRGSPSLRWSGEVSVPLPPVASSPDAPPRGEGEGLAALPPAMIPPTAEVGKVQQTQGAAEPQGGGKTTPPAPQGPSGETGSAGQTGQTVSPPSERRGGGPPSQPPASVTRENSEKLAPAVVNVPQWNAERVAERARAQMALAGVTGEQRPRYYWFIQVAAFREASVAAEVVTRLRQQGFEAYVAPDRGWQRVRVGPYTQEGEARQAADTIARVVRAQPQVIAARLP
ncbi:MAG: SPOR domain-containing protein [Hydrogenophilus sp.]|nr:SPOR domain-containing protein [Hydrogenophilus sp.]